MRIFVEMSSIKASTQRYFYTRAQNLSESKTQDTGIIDFSLKTIRGTAKTGTHN
jgi:hypothetical protein